MDFCGWVRKKTSLQAINKEESKLQVVKEEEVTSSVVSTTVEAEHGLKEDESEEEETASTEKRRDMACLVRKRTKAAKSSRRCSRDQSASAFRRLSPRVMISFVRRGSTSTTVVEITRLYSCSASRYLMFGSNRRYKPGD